MKVKVTRISKQDTNKDGVKLVDKNGKNYFRIGIQVEGQDGWLSGFANSTSDPRYNMVEGGTYSLTIENKVVGDKVYKNFKMLSAEEQELEDLREYKSRMEGVHTSAETSQSESHLTLDDFDSKF